MKKCKIELTDWISMSKAEEFPENKRPIIMGGFFKHGMRWDDYTSKLSDKIEYLEAIRKEVLRKNIRITSREHQSRVDPGVPFFSDGTALLFTMRAWGDLMAAIWSTEENEDYWYMDFYM